MSKNNERFENFLREFQPRQPRALPITKIATSAWVQRLAAVAIMTVTCGISMWFLWYRPISHDTALTIQKFSSARFKKGPRKKLSIVVLTRLAVDDPSSLDSVLDAQENALPRFDRNGSALQVLAQE